MALRISLSLVCAGAALLAGCASPHGSTPNGSDGPLLPAGSTVQTPADPSLEPEEFRQAESLWLMGEHGRAYRAFIDFTSRHPQSKRLGEAYLYAGMASEQHGDRENSRRCYEHAARDANRRVAARAALAMGEWSMRGDGFAEAAGHFRNAARLAADEETRAEATLKAGISLQKAGMFEDARALLQGCARNGALPKYADQARYRLEMDPFFTVQVGAFLKEQNARDKMQQLVRAGIDSELRAPGASGIPFYRVVSGRFPDRAAAVSHQRRIFGAIGGEEPMIVP